MIRSEELLATRARKAVVVAVLVAINVVFIVLNLQRYGYVSTERFDVGSALRLPAPSAAPAETETTDGTSAEIAAIGRKDSVPAPEQPAPRPEGWGGDRDDPVPSGPPVDREAVLTADGTVLLSGSVPSWPVATRLAGWAEARLGVVPGSVVNSYSWHPDASTDGRDGVVRLEEALLYEAGEAGVPADAEPTLDVLAAVLVINPSVFAVVTAHTDDFGESDSNAAVAFARAAAVRGHLAELGVVTEQVVVVAAPPGEPLASNDTADGRRLNRRVEIELENFLTPDPVGR